ETLIQPFHTTGALDFLPCESSRWRQQIWDRHPVESTPFPDWLRKLQRPSQEHRQQDAAHPEQSAPAVGSLPHQKSSRLVHPRQGVQTCLWSQSRVLVVIDKVPHQQHYKARCPRPSHLAHSSCLCKRSEIECSPPCNYPAHEISAHTTGSDQ